MSRADKHYVTGEIPMVINPTSPVAIRTADMVANVRLREALKAHVPASLVGRMVRRNRDLLSVARFNVGVLLAVVVGVVLINGGAW